MQRLINIKSFSIFIISTFFLIGCQPATDSNTTLVNTNTNFSNSFANNTNSGISNTNSTSTVVEVSEPDNYQATVNLKFEALGDGQKTALPALSANVARSGADRRMELALPTGEKIIYLDKAGTNYVIFPGRKQYAELNQESLGFEVRRFLMPEQIVQQVKNMQGVKLVGEEKLNGRDVIKYRYDSIADTQSQAGKVETESFLIVDKETGLPLRTETVSESSSSNVQGYKGMRVVTEMSDIKTNPDINLFTAPTDFQKIEPEQVKAQVNLIFSAATALIGQMMKAAQPNPTTTVSPAASPTIR